MKDKAGALSYEVNGGVSALTSILALGSAEHFLTDYGDETEYTLPWDLFNEESAEMAEKAARSSLQEARRVILAVQEWRTAERQ